MAQFLLKTKQSQRPTTASGHAPCSNGAACAPSHPLRSWDCARCCICKSSEAMRPNANSPLAKQPPSLPPRQLSQRLLHPHLYLCPCLPLQRPALAMNAPHRLLRKLRPLHPLLHDPRHLNLHLNPRLPPPPPLELKPTPSRPLQRAPPMGPALRKTKLRHHWPRQHLVTWLAKHPWRLKPPARHRLPSQPLSQAQRPATKRSSRVQVQHRSHPSHRPRPYRGPLLLLLLLHLRPLRACGLTAHHRRLPRPRAQLPGANPPAQIPNLLQQRRRPRSACSRPSTPTTWRHCVRPCNKARRPMHAGP